MTSKNKNKISATIVVAISILLSTLPLATAQEYVPLEDLPGKINTGGIINSIGQTIHNSQRLDLFALVIILYFIIYSSLTLKIKQTDTEGRTTQKEVNVFENQTIRYIFSAILAVVVAGVIPLERRRLLLVFIGGIFIIHFIFQKLGIFSQIERFIGQTTGVVKDTVPGSGLIKLLIKIVIWVLIVWLIYLLLMSFAQQLPLVNQLDTNNEIMGPLQLIGHLFGIAKGEPAAQGESSDRQTEPTTVFTSVQFWWNEVSVYGPQVNDILKQLEDPNLEDSQRSQLCQNARNILVDCFTGSISGHNTQKCSRDFVNTKYYALEERGCNFN